MNDIKRYMLNYGKFGAYFYDIRTNKDLTLYEVEAILNKYDNLTESQTKTVDKLIGFIGTKEKRKIEKYYYKCYWKLIHIEKYIIE